MQNNFCFYSWFLKVIFCSELLSVTFSKQSYGVCPVKISMMGEKTYNQVVIWNNIQNHIGGCAWEVSFLFAFFCLVFFSELEAYS